MVGNEGRPVVDEPGISRFRRECGNHDEDQKGEKSRSHVCDAAEKRVVRVDQQNYDSQKQERDRGSRKVDRLCQEGD